MKRILVTGGAGFLGQKIIEKFYDENEITVYSRDEAKHYYLEKKFPKVKFVIGDVRNRKLLISTSKNHDIGIFAASLKQIDTCSKNIEEAVQTIIHGALNSKEAAIQNNFESACFISTDKSRAATTIYGAMKYIAGESFILNNDQCDTRFSTVIYGNVMNSTGSLIPLIWNAINNDITLTLYSRDMTRFMIDIEDAVELIKTSLLFKNVSTIPELPSFYVKDMFEIYESKFGLKYKIGIPRTNEKIHEIMAGPEEIPRMSYLKDNNCYIMSPNETFNTERFLNNNYSSGNSPILQGSLYTYLEKRGFYK